MTASEEIKLQAKLLEWEAPKGLGASTEGYENEYYMWITNGMILARISIFSCMLNVPLLDSIERFTKLPEGAVKGWLTEMRFKDEREGMLVRAEAIEAIDVEVWVKEKYIQLFCKAEYDVWITPKALWLTEPDTREVLGVIARVRGINKKLEALRHKKGDKNGRN